MRDIAAASSQQQPQRHLAHTNATSSAQQGCTCLCADTMPIVAGFSDGRVVFWRWRPLDAAAEAQLAAVAPAAVAAPH